MGAYACSMPHPAQPAPHKGRSSFGDLLASFTSKLQSDGWDDSALEDDVTTISYEQALRSARRSHIIDRKSTRLNSSHANISYAVFCLKKKRLPTLNPSPTRT